MRRDFPDRLIAVQHAPPGCHSSAYLEDQYRWAISWRDWYQQVEANCRDPVLEDGVVEPQFIDASLDEEGRIAKQSQIRTLLWYLRGALLRHGCKHWGPPEEVGLLNGTMWHITLQEERSKPGYVAVTKIEDPWDTMFLKDFDNALRRKTGKHGGGLFCLGLFKYF